MTPRASRISLLRLWAALAGIVSAAVVLAVAEVIAAFVGAAGSPLFAVGSLVIDLAPPGAKDFMIALFGTGDKAALLTLMAVILLVLAALAGVLEVRRTPWGVVLFGIGALLALIAVLTRAGATGFNGVPTVVGAVVGVVVLRILAQRLANWKVSEAKQARVPQAFAPTTQLERRSFLRLAIVAGAASVIVGTGARLINSTSSVVTDIRTKLTLPKPVVAAPAVPAGASLDIEGVSPLVTPNADFYRIDTAFSPPSINPDDWKLKITGMVENEVELTFAELADKPLIEHFATLSCVSNEVGGDLVGNALWLGYPIRELLKQAVPKAGADMVLSTSIDGFTAGTPLDVLQDEGTEALLAIGMNGEPLPVEHGFPVRMVVPGLYGYVSATKWVVELKVTKFANAEGYWTPRGWDAKGPTKLSSRIDTPRADSSITAGKVAVAGVAWSPHNGVSAVEVQVDDGAWVEARLADSISVDTWRQWVYEWPASKGSHQIQVRATDTNGTTQSDRQLPPAPNGSEGWAQINIRVD
ncbi:molybdopterin-dependent oxidoreductase [Glaciihabitans sp. UYNi722]|uniref:molybdopterin-dependent oxidoreductase n=1 Tax=Glaciihabitans sp. UYNi722 TaxID=3156344 RepID=UPI00339576EC